MVKLMMNFVFLGLLLQCLEAVPPTPPDFSDRIHICAKPNEFGHCHDRQIRWYYDKTSKSCEPFYYSGCGGNYNRFLRKSGCTDYCMDPDYDGLDLIDSIEKMEVLSSDFNERLTTPLPFAHRRK